MIYKWKTWVQDILNDPEVQESLDEDLTEICVKGGWEVWQIDYVMLRFPDNYEETNMVRRVITLRSINPLPDDLLDQVRVKANSVKMLYSKLNYDEAQWDNYVAELEHFYLATKEILGLK